MIISSWLKSCWWLAVSVVWSSFLSHSLHWLSFNKWLTLVNGLLSKWISDWWSIYWLWLRNILSWWVSSLWLIHRSLLLLRWSNISHRLLSLLNWCILRLLDNVNLLCVNRLLNKLFDLLHWLFNISLLLRSWLENLFFGQSSLRLSNNLWSSWSLGWGFQLKWLFVFIVFLLNLVFDLLSEKSVSIIWHFSFGLRKLLLIVS